MFSSSCVRAVGYDSDQQDLTVRFPSGRRYVYRNVPAEVFTLLVDAESPGNVYNTEIKGRFEVKELVDQSS